MTEIIAIAKNTFKEAIRNRILYVILIFAILLILFSGIVSELVIDSGIKIIKSLGFSAINLFGVAIAVFVGVSLVYNELEKKTIYTIVSKPIGRWQFLLGKYFGLLLTVWVNVFIMSAFFLAAIHYYAAAQAGTDAGVVSTIFTSIGKGIVNLVAWNAFPATQAVMPVIGITCIELAIITAFAVLFSSFSTPTLSMFFTVLTFIAGRMNSDIIRFMENIEREMAKVQQATGVPQDFGIAYHFANVAAHITPNLGAFSKAVEHAIYDQSVGIWWGTLVYGVVYTAGILCLSMLVFQQRNFK